MCFTWRIFLRPDIQVESIQVVAQTVSFVFGTHCSQITPGGEARKTCRSRVRVVPSKLSRSAPPESRAQDAS